MNIASRIVGILLLIKISFIAVEVESRKDNVTNTNCKTACFVSTVNDYLKGKIMHKPIEDLDMHL